MPLRLLRQLWAPAQPESGKTPPAHTPHPVSSSLSETDRLLLADGLSLIIPSVASRAEHVRMALTHLQTLDIPTRIFLSDHSVKTERQAIQEIVDHFDERLNITLVHHDPELHFLERLVDCAQRAETPYVVVHADDDRMLAHALARSVEFLNHHEDHVACIGRIFFVRVSKQGPARASVQPVATRAEDHPGQRVFAHCKTFTPTLYAMTRRISFIQANSSALSFTSNVIFWQYLSSSLLVSLGKLKALDDLYYFRLDNPGGWRATLVKERDRTHWPYLITADNFSTELSRFKAGLRSVFQPNLTSQTAVEDLIDDCCLGLVQRAFGVGHKHTDSDMALVNRLHTPGHVEHDALMAFAADSAASLDRIHDPTSG